MKRANYSSGTLWLTIDNLPRSIQFLRENTFLLLIIPGPTEPNTEQLNGLLEPFVQELEDLSEGMYITTLSNLLTLITGITGEFFKVFGHQDLEQIHVALPFGTMDTPARLKTAGFVSQNSEEHMCPCCDAPFSSLVDPVCFDRSSRYFFSICIEFSCFCRVLLSELREAAQMEVYIQRF